MVPDVDPSSILTDLRRRVRERLRGRVPARLWQGVPAPNGSHLVVALAVATVAVVRRSSVRLNPTGHAVAPDGPVYLYDVTFSFFPAYSEASFATSRPPWVTVASVSTLDLPLLGGLPLPAPVVPSAASLGVGLLAVAAGVYVVLEVLGAVVRRTDLDLSPVGPAPAAVTPTWPRLGLVVAVVGVDAAAAGHVLLFEWLYRGAGGVLASGGLFWQATVPLAGSESVTVPPAGVAVFVVQAALALLVTYLLVCGTAAAVTSLVLSGTDPDRRSNRTHL